jgi:hypothetical protein
LSMRLNLKILPEELGHAVQSSGPLAQVNTFTLVLLVLPQYR